jgi:hypothetical protein
MNRVILACALTTLAAGAAFANEPTSTATSADPAATFKTLDTNGDGRISETEARAHAELNAGFRDAVSDASAGMTMEEFNAWVASRPASQTPPSN